MKTSRLIFLLAVALLASGFKFRCLFFCEEQTGVQGDYVDNRDDCRDFAQEKLDMEMKATAKPLSGKEGKARLVVLFGECMAEKGWDVPIKTASGSPSTPAVAPVVASTSATASTSTLPPASTLSTKAKLPARPDSSPLMVEVPDSSKSEDMKPVARSSPVNIKKQFPKAKEAAKAQQDEMEKPINKPIDKYVENPKPEPKSEAKQETKPENKIDVKSEPQTQTAAPVQKVEEKTLEAPQKAVQSAKKPEQSIGSKRSGECSFARRFASFSAASAAKAEACDLECAEQLKSPLKNFIPAACPSDILQKSRKAK